MPYVKLATSTTPTVTYVTHNFTNPYVYQYFSMINGVEYPDINNFMQFLFNLHTSIVNSTTISLSIVYGGLNINNSIGARVLILDADYFANNFDF